MEKKLDFKFLIIAVLANITMLVVMTAIGAVVGAKLETPQSVIIPAALISVGGAGAITGVICARLAPSSPMAYAIVSALAVTIIICSASLLNNGDSSWVQLAIPLLAMAAPPAVVLVTTPKNNSKRKLKQLGVKL